jgi:hypothetical protein
LGAHVDALRAFVKFRHPAITTLQLVPPAPSARHDGDSSSGLSLDGRGEVSASQPIKGGGVTVDAQCDARAESYQDDAVLVWPLFAGDARFPEPHTL